LSSEKWQYLDIVTQSLKVETVSNKLYKFVKLHPLLSSLLMFWQPLLRNDSLQLNVMVIYLVIDVRKLVGPIFSFRHHALTSGGEQSFQGRQHWLF